MRILAVNAGSSSLKLSVVDGNGRIEEEQQTGGDADPITALRGFVARAGDVDGVAHRLVHGGAAIRRATLVDDEVRRRLDAAIQLAPLHLPGALALLDAARAIVDRPQVVCVDTAFHADIPDCATTYAVPADWRAWGVRRYGFHGLSYEFIAGRLRETLPDIAKGRVILAHLGSGASMCALKDGHSVESTLGFTALDGLPMGTRCGQIDPGVVLFLLQREI